MKQQMVLHQKDDAQATLPLNAETTWLSVSQLCTQHLQICGDFPAAHRTLVYGLEASVTEGTTALELSMALLIASQHFRASFEAYVCWTIVV